MKISGFVAVVLLTSPALFAQSRGTTVGGSRPSAPVAAAPATQRAVGSVLYPAGAVPPVGSGTPFVNTSIPGRVGPGRDRPRSAVRPGSYVYAYPVYVGGGYGGGYGSGYYDSSYTNQPGYGQDQQQQPNVVVIYPPQQPPVIINQFGSGDPQYATRVQPQNLVYPPAPQSAQGDDSSTPETSHYLLAFKDHSIYSAVAYWVDGDTLHYFTTPTTHNQASVSLVDRELTERLNKESGAEVKLPPPAR